MLHKLLLQRHILVAAFDDIRGLASLVECQVRLRVRSLVGPVSAQHASRAKEVKRVCYSLSHNDVNFVIVVFIKGLVLFLVLEYGNWWQIWLGVLDHWHFWSRNVHLLASWLSGNCLFGLDNY